MCGYSLFLNVVGSADDCFVPTTSYLLTPLLQEEDGNVSGAADVLQDVHVETYGSLSKKEKIEYILEQLRLTLAKKDFVRAAIVSGKINRKHLADLPDYKVRFFQLLSTLHRHHTDALELVKDYHAIYLTLVNNNSSTSEEGADAMEQEDTDTAWKEALQATVAFLALSPYGNEQQDILNRVHLDPNLKKLPSFQYVALSVELVFSHLALSFRRKTVQLLLQKEIIQYPFANASELENLPAVQEGDLASHWHDIFHQRIIQHNIRVVALYYKRIQLTRLAELLGVEPSRLETEIASMVSDSNACLYAKMDRPANIVRFAKKQSPEEVLTAWASDIDKLLHLVEITAHLIHKEKVAPQ